MYIYIYINIIINIWILSAKLKTLERSTPLLHFHERLIINSIGLRSKLIYPLFFGKAVNQTCE